MCCWFNKHIPPLSATSFSWFFENVLRKEADKLLLAEENPRGTFLVRPSEHNPNGYSLSVKDWEDGRGYHVKHYRIKPLDNGGYYIATNQTFPSLQALVMAYSSKLSISCTYIRQYSRGQFMVPNRKCIMWLSKWNTYEFDETKYTEQLVIIRTKFRRNEMYILTSL